MIAWMIYKGEWFVLVCADGAISLSEQWNRQVINHGIVGNQC